MISVRFNLWTAPDDKNFASGTVTILGKKLYVTVERKKPEDLKSDRHPDTVVTVREHFEKS